MGDGVRQGGEVDIFGPIRVPEPTLAPQEAEFTTAAA